MIEVKTEHGTAAFHNFAVATVRSRSDGGCKIGLGDTEHREWIDSTQSVSEVVHLIHGGEPVEDRDPVAKTATYTLNVMLDEMKRLGHPETINIIFRWESGNAIEHTIVVEPDDEEQADNDA